MWVFIEHNSKECYINLAENCCNIELSLWFFKMFIELLYITKCFLTSGIFKELLLLLNLNRTLQSSFTVESEILKEQ